MTLDYATYIAGLPRILAGAGVLFRDAQDRILIVETTYREDGKWILPGGTVESDKDESPRQGARREAAEEIGLDVVLGALLAIDWIRGPGRPPLVYFLYDGGVLDDAQLAVVQLQDQELSAWRMVTLEEAEAYVAEAMHRRISAALTAQRNGTGTAELEDGHPAGRH